MRIVEFHLPAFLPSLPFVLPRAESALRPRDFSSTCHYEIYIRPR